jgi:hypothetical protein
MPMGMGVAMFLMISFYVLSHTLLLPALKLIAVSHKINFSPEWLPKREAMLATATTRPHLLSPT